jgi:PST family polysaccharide transporter
MVIEVTKTIGILALMVLFGRGMPYLLGPGLGEFSRGEPWACASIGVSFSLGSFAYLWVFKQTDGIPLWRQLQGILPPILACLPMVAAILVARRLLAPLGLAPGLRLSLETLTGIAAFLPTVFVMAPRTSQEFVGLARKALSRRARPAEA